MIETTTVGLAAKAAFPLIIACARTASKSIWNKIKNRNQILIPSAKHIQPISEWFEREIVKYADENLDQSEFENLEKYLGSRDFTAMVQQIFVFQLTGRTINSDGMLIRCFEQGMLRHGIENANDVGSLYRVLTFACSKIFDMAKVDDGDISTETLIQANSIVATNYLSSIDQQISRLVHDKTISLDVVDAQVDLLRQAIARRFARIQPQSFDGAEPVPMDGLYVFPTLDSDDGEMSSVDMKQLLELQRIVIVGDPGGGKTTLTSKIAGDLASGKLSIEGLADQLVPFVIVLREFGSHHREKKGSVVDYIVEKSRTVYQVDLEISTVQFLLDTGRIFVIFDGLDELLEPQDRKDIAEIIDTFSWMNPMVHVLTTSRRIGYAHNPMDHDVFVKLTLGAFNSKQVETYVQNWFTLYPDGSLSEKELAAQQFMLESNHAEDIRSNPLMLGLMCTLYRRESYIPRSRPDLYEKCSTMLFESWDKNRGLFRPLRFEAHVKYALSYIANVIYDDQDLQAGVSERKLVDIATTYLMGRAFSDQADAELAAKELVQYCQGRTWVLTEVGLSSNHEALFQFSHRTFLEYFAAVHIARTAVTLDDLCSKIIPGISSGDLDVVAELAFQIRTRDTEGAPDYVIDKLMSEHESNADQNSKNIIAQFATRSLSYSVLLPLSIEKIVSLALNSIFELEVTDREKSKRSEVHLDENLAPDRDDRLASVENLARCITESRDQVITKSCDLISARINLANERTLESAVGFGWQFPSFFGYASENISGELEGAPDQILEIRQLSISKMIVKYEEWDWAAIALYYSGHIPMNILIDANPDLAFVNGAPVPWSSLTYIRPSSFELAKLIEYAIGKGSDFSRRKASQAIEVCAEFFRNGRTLEVSKSDIALHRFSDFAMSLRRYARTTLTSEDERALTDKEICDGALMVAVMSEFENLRSEESGSSLAELLAIEGQSTLISWSLMVKRRAGEISDQSPDIDDALIWKWMDGTLSFLTIVD
ncbi:NACHT domain-containing protein [Rhodococcus sp. IEGM 1366]|uniref:NACHT domain-containing protein n=1 Tax=Rhodococcus sp. IEGM 1366 TaxID=3082223 RepID=UPI00295483BC|nr:NACHT domain-containing protein [Rhodococcus sp. IEGM 1366]MDV8071140.1 NACHT domain-containing protein [Rhodococcus sp. IEGM 1366]